MEEGLRMRTEDLSYLKEGFRILSLCGAWTRICRLYPSLPETMQADGRLRFYEVLALDETGSPKQAFELMEADGGLVLDDVREGETNLGGLWQRLQKSLPEKRSRCLIVMILRPYSSQDWKTFRNGQEPATYYIMILEQPEHVTEEFRQAGRSGEALCAGRKNG